MCFIACFSHVFIQPIMVLCFSLLYLQNKYILDVLPSIRVPYNTIIMSEITGMDNTENVEPNSNEVPEEKLEEETKQNDIKPVLAVAEGISSVKPISKTF